MADIELTGTIVPKNSGTFPIAQAIHIKGGYHAVADNTARDAIPTSRRVAGMGVYSVGAATLYILGAGLTNSDWTVSNSATVPPLSSVLFADKNTSVLSGNDGSIGAPFATLAAAIAAASDGDTIKLVGGSSYGNVTITAKDLLFIALGDVTIGNITSDSELGLQGQAPGSAGFYVDGTIDALSVSANTVTLNDTVTCTDFRGVDVAPFAIVATGSARLERCKNAFGAFQVTTPFLVAEESNVDWTPTDPADHGELYNCTWVYDTGAPGFTMPTSASDLIIDDATRLKSGLGLVVDSPSGDKDDYLPGGDPIAWAAAHTAIIQPAALCRIGGFAQPVHFQGLATARRKRIVAGSLGTVVLRADGTGSTTTSQLGRDNATEDVYLRKLSSVELLALGAPFAWTMVDQPAPLQGPRFSRELIEEFDGGTYSGGSPTIIADWGLLKGDSDGANGGSIVKATLNDASIEGAVILTSGTGSSSYASIYGGGTYTSDLALQPGAANAMRVEWRVYLPTLSNGTNTYRLFAGFSNGFTGTFPTIGAGVDYLSSSSPNWRGWADNNVSPTITVSSIPVTAAVMHTLVAYKPVGSASVWYFYADDVLVAKVTTNTPSGQPIFPLCSIVRTAGSGGVARVESCRTLFQWPSGR